MNYVTASGEATGETVAAHPGQVLVRKLTESQGARSDYYDTPETTTRDRHAFTQIPRPPRLPASNKASESGIHRATREHVERLLRECASKSAQLVDIPADPMQSAMLGGQLVSLLSELWAYRHSREEDWIELLNVTQILVAKEDFETLSTEKRRSIALAFSEGLCRGQIGPSDVRRVLERLIASGFDIWRGLEETTLGD